MDSNDPTGTTKVIKDEWEDDCQEKVKNHLFCFFKNREIRRTEHLIQNILKLGVVKAPSLNSSKEDVVERAKEILTQSNYHYLFEKRIEVEINNKMLLVNYDLPSIDGFLTIEEYKQIASSNQLTEKPYSANKRSQLYELALYSICLRSIYELFYTDKDDQIEIITFNGFVTSTNKTNGKLTRKCIISIQVSKDRFNDINLLEVDPKSCFKGLKGVSASKLIDVVPITPVLSFDKNDHRFIESHDVITNSGTNLAAMPWEDFEQLVRTLFEKEFSKNGSEVRVTQASRDGGVDAVIFDPDPLRGGKIVVQAKRYTNTVGVSAVRDLYGTVINEGANSGILITTSDYGPDSYEFAKDKPIKLLNSGHLLALLQKNSMDGYINLEEAKQLNAEKD